MQYISSDQMKIFAGHMDHIQLVMNIFCVKLFVISWRKACVILIQTETMMFYILIWNAIKIIMLCH